MNVNELPIMDLSDNLTECCPRFHPEPWDEKTFHFDKMLFARAHTRSFFHIPLNFAKVMTQSQSFIDAANGNDPERYFMLSQDTSSWKANHYFKVSKEIPGMEMTHLSGTFMTKVYDSSYREFPKLIKNFEQYIESKEEVMKELFIFYTTCPECADTYGHNYMVFFAKI